jgi:mono/diheme cytochrome c family protein
MKETTMRSVSFVAFVTCLSSYAAAGVQEPTGAAGGKIIFRQICATCHGTDARGTGPVAESLKTPPPDLTRISARRGGDFPAETIASFIDGREKLGAHGPRDMPVWGDSLAQAVDDSYTRERRIDRAVYMLVDYLKTLQE